MKRTWRRISGELALWALWAVAFLAFLGLAYLFVRDMVEVFS